MAGVFQRNVFQGGGVFQVGVTASVEQQYGGRRHYRPLSPYDRAQRQQALEREQAAEAKREQDKLKHTATIHNLVRGEIQTSIQTAIENDEAAIILLLLS